LAQAILAQSILVPCPSPLPSQARPQVRRSFEKPTSEMPRGQEKEINQRGADLISARNARQEEMFDKATWCLYLYYGGFGCMNPMAEGCCTCIGEVCCLAGTCKSATCCDGDGCLANTTKCCCALSHVECPPSLTPGFGCGGSSCMYGGNLTEEKRQEKLDAGNEAEVEEFDMLSTTCWCFFCYCCGFGCNSPGGSDPCLLLEGKVCCVWASIETDKCCGDDGWIEYTGKCCCCVCDASYPAGVTPGCVICTKSLCCAQNMKNSGGEE